MSREVFFIADDFGLEAAINAAVVRAHCEGALHGASLMMGQRGTLAAVALAHQQPRLQIGWHLHLCDSLPVTCRTWPWGDSPARAGWAIGFSPRARRLMRQEMVAQWEQFRATGLPCAFVNVHHHLHAHPLVYATLLELLPLDFTGWLRLGAPRHFKPTFGQRLVESTDRWCWQPRRRRCRYRTSDTLWGLDRLHGMRAAEVAAVAQQLPPGRHEFMFHPRSTAEDADGQCLIQLRSLGY